MTTAYNSKLIPGLLYVLYITIQSREYTATHNTAKAMMLNSNTALISSKILLVPYEPHHVSTYHGWMEDEEILEATASDRLTLDAEYEMQERWRRDDDKLTFISCIPPVEAGGGDGGDGGVEYILARKDDAPEKMVGDVNLFLYDQEEDEEEEGGGGGDCSKGGGRRRVIGEIELMIATRKDQGRGLGRASVLLFLYYVLTRKSEIVAARGPAGSPELAELRVKVSRSNLRSMGLFESLGFAKRSEAPNYFGEVELAMVNLDVERVVERMRGCGIEGWREVEYKHS